MYIDIQKLKKTFDTQTAIDIDKLHDFCYPISGR